MDIVLVSNKENLAEEMSLPRLGNKCLSSVLLILHTVLLCLLSLTLQATCCKLACRETHVTENQRKPLVDRQGETEAFSPAAHEEGNPDNNDLSELGSGSPPSQDLR